jgi:hypothetical protein
VAFYYRKYIIRRDKFDWEEEEEVDIEQPALRNPTQEEIPAGSQLSEENKEEEGNSEQSQRAEESEQSQLSEKKDGDNKKPGNVSHTREF